MTRKLWILLPVIAFTLLLGSCAKIVEQQQRDILVNIMTNGQWYVESFKENTDDVSKEFEGYNFQFKDNGTIDGLKNGVSVRGTWVGDLQNLSIKSNFPSSAPDPLKKLNGNWKVINTSMTYVQAEMSSLTGKNILHLRKQP